MATITTDVKASPPRQAPAATTAPVKHRKLRFALIALAVVVAVFAFLTLYIQSAHGFKNVLMPLVADRVPGVVQVERGSVKLTGKVELNGAKYVANDGSIDFQADRLFASVSPLSFVIGDRPVIHLVEASRATLITRDSGEAKPEEKPDEKESKKEELPTSIPITIERIRIDEFTAGMMEGEKKEISIGPAKLYIDDLSPGKTGKIHLETAFALAPEDEARAHSGSTTLDLEIAEDSKSKALTVKGNGGAQVNTPAGKGPSPLDFTLTVDGKIESDRVAGNTAIAAKSGADSLGDVKANVNWQPGSGAENSPDPMKIDALVELKSITRHFLNPILAMAGPGQIESGMLNGKIELKTEGDVVRFVSDVQGDDLSLKPDSEKPATPAIVLRSSQKGSWNSKAQALQIEEAAISLDQESRQILSAKLDQPLDLDLKKKEGDAASSAAAAPEVHATATIDKLSVKNLQGWMAALGNDALVPVEEGNASGDVKVTIGGNGQSIDFDGNLTIAEVVIKKSGTDETIGPIAVTSKLTGDFQEMKRLTLQPTTVKLAVNGDAMAEASVQGTYDTEAGAADLSARLDAPRVIELFDRLGALTEEQRGQVRGGAATGTLSFNQPSKDKGFLVSMNFDLGDLTLIAGEGRELSRSFSLAGQAQSNDAQNEVELKDVALKVAQDGGAGTVTAAGRMPMKFDGSARDGELKIAVRDVECAPWLELFDVLKKDQLGPLPLEADVKLAVDSKAEKITLEGTEAFIVRLKESGGAAEDIKVTLQNRVDRPDKQTTNFNVALDAPRRSGPADKVRIEGSSVTPAADAGADARPKVKLVALVDHLDGAIYVDPFMAEPEQEAPKPIKEESPTAPTPTPVPVERDAKPATGLPVDLDVDVEVTKFILRELQVEDLKLKATGEGGDVRADLAQAKLLGGSLKGLVNYDLASADQKIDWDLKGDSLNLTTLQEALSPGEEHKVEGILKFTTAGSGVTARDADLLNSIDGRVDFGVSDGKLSGLRALEFIADKTGIDGFRKTLFHTFDGGAKIEKGIASLENVEVKGSAVQMRIEGTAGLQGTLDLAINPRVGPTLADKVPSNRFTNLLVKTVEGVTVIPIDVTVRGPFEDLRFGVRPRAPDALGSGTQLVKDAVGGVVKEGEALLKNPLGEGAAIVGGVLKGGEQATEGTAKTGEKAVEGTADAVKQGAEKVGGLLRGALGGNKDKKDNP